MWLRGRGVGKGRKETHDQKKGVIQGESDSLKFISRMPLSKYVQYVHGD